MAAITFQCFSCNQVLRVSPDKAGRKAKCIKCGTILTIPEAVQENGVPPPLEPGKTPARPAEQTAIKAPPPIAILPEEQERPRNRFSDAAEEDDRPRSKRRFDDEDDEDDDRPRKRRHRDDEDDLDDDRPRKRRRRDDDNEDDLDDDDDRPRRKRRRNEEDDLDDDDDRARRRERDEEDDFDDDDFRPRGRRNYEDDDDYDRARHRDGDGSGKSRNREREKRRQLKLMRTGLGLYYARFLTMAISAAVGIGCVLLAFLGALTGAAGLFVVAGYLSMAAGFCAIFVVPILGIIGGSLTLRGPARSGAFGLAIAALVLDAAVLLFILISIFLAGNPMLLLQQGAGSVMVVMILMVLSWLGGFIVIMIMLSLIAKYLKDRASASTAIMLLIAFLSVAFGGILLLILLALLLVRLGTAGMILMFVAELAFSCVLTFILFRIAFLVQEIRANL